MNFLDALKELGDGKRIRKDSWPSDYYIGIPPWASSTVMDSIGKEYRFNGNPFSGEWFVWKTAKTYKMVRYWFKHETTGEIEVFEYEYQDKGEEPTYGEIFSSCNFDCGSSEYTLLKKTLVEEFKA